MTEEKSLVKRSSSVELFKMKRLLDALASKEGRHTELISLYIPPDRKISDVLGMLHQEYGTASNIKSRTTRHYVQDAIEKVIQRVKLLREPPPNGLAVFAGMIPHGAAGNEEMEVYVVSPPEPISIYLYRCDSRFHVEHLFEMIREKDTYGILVMDGSDATYATVKGKHLEIQKTITSGISSKHRAGGQSARRFERLREAEVNEYYKRVADYAGKIFLNTSDLRGIIVGGPGPTKQYFLDGEYLHYNLRNKVLGAVDTAYTDEQGIKEVVVKAPEILKNVRYFEEKSIVQQFLRELGQDSGLAVYGLNEVERSLKAGSLRTLLISEEVNLTNVSLTCSNCGYSGRKNVKSSELAKFRVDIGKELCPKCSGPALQVTEERDLIDLFTEAAEQADVDVEIISASHEEGQMLLRSFGGIAGILRYKG